MNYQVLMAKTFREALLSAVAERQTTLRAVAEGSKVSYEQLKKVGQREGAKTNVDDAIRVARFFGLTLDEFLSDDLASDRAEIAKLYSQLTEAEIEILRAAARGRSDLRQTPEKQ